jgi:hypothetical protein
MPPNVLQVYPLQVGLPSRHPRPSCGTVAKRNGDFGAVIGDLQNAAVLKVCDQATRRTRESDYWVCHISRIRDPRWSVASSTGKDVWYAWHSQGASITLSSADPLLMHSSRPTTPPVACQPAAGTLREAHELVEWLAAEIRAGRQHVLTEVGFRRPELAVVLAVALTELLPKVALNWVEREGRNAGRIALCRLLEGDPKNRELLGLARAGVLG